MDTVGREAQVDPGLVSGADAPRGQTGVCSTRTARIHQSALATAPCDALHVPRAIAERGHFVHVEPYPGEVDRALRPVRERLRPVAVRVLGEPVGEDLNPKILVLFKMTAKDAAYSIPRPNLTDVV